MKGIKDFLGFKETAVIFGFCNSNSVLLFSLVWGFFFLSQVTERVLCWRKQHLSAVNASEGWGALRNLPKWRGPEILMKKHRLQRVSVAFHLSQVTFPRIGFLSFLLIFQQLRVRF